MLGLVWREAQRHVAEELNLSDPSSICFAGNAHDFLVRIVSAVERRPVRILATTEEFASFKRQARRWNESGEVEIHLVSPCALHIAAREAQYEIIYVSQVFFRTGRLYDWHPLADLARPEGPWVVVDGYHGFMALPTDLSDVADRLFYIAGGYKYATAGEGVGLLHAPPGFGLRPSLTGWFANQSLGETGETHQVEYPPDARRFMGSTFDPSGLYRFNAVQQMLAREGLQTGQSLAQVRNLQEFFLTECDMREFAPLFDPNSCHRSRFLAFEGANAMKLGMSLRDEGIIVDARSNLLRIGFGLYQDEKDVIRLTASINRYFSS